MTKRLIFIAGALVSVGCLVWIVSSINLRDFWDAFGSLNFFWLVPTVVVFYSSMVLRGYRWALLFRPDYRVPGLRMFKPVMIGFAFNNILPSGRVGEVMRALYVGKKEETGLPFALGTIVTERIFDAITLLVFFGGSLLLIPAIDPNIRIEFGGFSIEGSMLAPLIKKIVIGAVVLLGIVGVLLIPQVPLLMKRWLERIRFVPNKVREMGLNLIDGLCKGLRAITQWRVLVGVVVYSLLIWALNAFTAVVLAFGFDGISMSFVQAVALMSLVTVCVMIPAAPGYWGLYEAGMIFGLKVLGIQQDISVATAYGIIMHLIFFAPTVVMGLIFAAQSQLKVGDSGNDR